MLKADNPADRWKQILDGYGEFAGEPLTLIDQVYMSEAETNYRNRAIANLLYAYDRLYSDPMEAVDVYTRQCSVGVTARQLAMMGATLANGGVNPKTGKAVLNKDYVDEVVPGRMAIAAFSPRLNEAGNSVRALSAIQHISDTLELSLFK